VGKRKTALVTGSAKGLGRMSALALAHQGCNVIVNYVHSRHKALELVEQIQQLGVSSLAIEANIADSDDLRQMVNQA